jgi:hypothetical protein
MPGHPAVGSRFENYLLHAIDHHTADAGAGIPPCTQHFAIRMTWAATHIHGLSRNTSQFSSAGPLTQYKQQEDAGFTYAT